MEPIDSPDIDLLCDAAMQIVKRSKSPVRRTIVTSRLREWFDADASSAATAVHALVRAKRLHVLDDGRLWWEQTPPTEISK